MQFHLRDLLWLKAVVGLASALFADRQFHKLQKATWEAATELQAAQTAAEVAGLQARIGQLTAQSRIMSHQITVQLQREREKDEALQLALAAAQRHETRQFPATRFPAHSAADAFAPEAENSAMP